MSIWTGLVFMDLHGVMVCGCSFVKNTVQKWLFLGKNRRYRQTDKLFDTIYGCVFGFFLQVKFATSLLTCLQGDQTV